MNTFPTAQRMSVLQTRDQLFAVTSLGAKQGIGFGGEVTDLAPRPGSMRFLGMQPCSITEYTHVGDDVVVREHPDPRTITLSSILEFRYSSTLEDRALNFVAAFHGTTATTLTRGRYLAYDQHEAWLIDATAGTATRLLQHGWEGQAEPVPAMLDGFTLLRIEEDARAAVHPLTWIAEYAPGWSPIVQDLATAAAHQVPGVRIIDATVRDAGELHIRLAGVPADQAPVLEELVAEARGAAAERCMDCGMPGAQVPETEFRSLVLCAEHVRARGLDPHPAARSHWRILAQPVAPQFLEAPSDIEIGWRPLLAILSRRLYDLRVPYEIEEVLEEHGGMRIQAAFGDAPAEDIARAREAVRAAEAQSWHVCELCAAPGMLSEDPTGRYRTRCKECNDYEQGPAMRRFRPEAEESCSDIDRGRRVRGCSS
ncbi:hypothetical protein [Leucobacter sp. GX24907]